MISAEHYALEDQAVRDLLGLREKEVAYYANVLNSIGIQSALICGFSVTFLSCYTPYEGFGNSNFIYVYFVPGAISIAVSMNTIISAAFASIW